MYKCFEGTGNYCRHYIFGDCVLPPECGKPNDPVATESWKAGLDSGCVRKTDKLATAT